MTSVWWDDNDAETKLAVSLLGGIDAVTSAVQEILPDRTTKIRTLTPGVSGASVFAAYPASVQEGVNVAQVSGVLKLAPSAQLADETSRYNKWVRDVLENPASFPALLAPEFRGPVGSLAAILYRRVGETTLGARLAELDQRHDTETALGLIDQVFQIVGGWEEISLPDHSRALTDTGVYSFRSDPFPEFLSVCGQIDPLKTGLDPISPTVVARAQRFWEPGALEPERFLTAAGHGDLHTDNAMVDNADAVKLIDFGSAGMGHFLRDSATLEIHSILRALSPREPHFNSSSRGYLQDILKLYTRDSFWILESNPNDSVAQGVVKRLRRHVWLSLFTERDEYLPQYILALARHAIRITVRQDFAFTESQRWIAAHVSASLVGLIEVRSGRIRLVSDAVRAPLSPNRAGPQQSKMTIETSGGVCRSETWFALAEAILQAQRVDLAGMAPVPLVSAIQERWPEPPAVPLMGSLRYVTRPQSEIYSRRRSVSGHRLWQAWTAALTGLRNLAMTLSSPTGSPLLESFSATSDQVTENCLLRITQRDGSVCLYHLSPVQVLSAPPVPTYVLSEISDNDGEVDDWMSRIIVESSALVLREVACKLPAVEVDNRQFTALEVAKLYPKGARSIGENEAKPTALTFLRSNGRNGASVLLRVRSRLTDHDDFGKVSLFSTIVQEEDLAASIDQVPSVRIDAGSALDFLWAQADYPTPFTLPLEAFIAAAQGDIFAKSHLDLETGRFEFKGMHILDREDIPISLAFAVFVVDLSVEEVRSAVNFSPAGLVEVPTAELYTSGLQLNRFLRRRQDWILTNCLNGA